MKEMKEKKKFICEKIHWLEQAHKRLADLLLKATTGKEVHEKLRSMEQINHELTRLTRTTENIEEIKNIEDIENRKDKAA